MPSLTRFDGSRAFRFLEQLCALGPRPSGSAAMFRQRDLLTRHFAGLGATVTRQSFTTRHPETATPVAMSNLVVEWHPERTRRVLIGAHYDTRPWPDRESDPAARLQPFLGANDGASGVAVLSELAHHMAGIGGTYGVDFALFDAEEFVFDDRRDAYFLGSSVFAREYRAHPPDHRYRWGLVVDMVGDADLQIYQERFSARYALPVVQSLWEVARRQRATQFVPRVRHRVEDDHLPLNHTARIPTCLVIDFDFPSPGAKISYWHTRHDTPDKCSPRSLAVVGNVILEWLREMQ